MSLPITATAVRPEVLALASLLTDGRITEGHLLQAAGRLGVTVHAEPMVVDAEAEARATAEAAARRELAAAEQDLATSIRLYDRAKAGIGEANRTVLPAASKYLKPVVLSADRVRARKSQAFRELNQRRAEKRLAAARAALLALAN